MTKSLSCSGILKGTALIDWDEDETDVLKTVSFVVDGFGTYTGDFGLESFSIGGEHNEAATFEASFESGGKITFTAAST